MASPIRIGARGSRLSRAQAGMLQLRIAAALGAPPEEADRVAPLVFITTTGDRIQDRRLLEAGGKALFVKEIEQALLDGTVDCAVHSLKDVPTEMPDGLVLAAFPEREDPRDAFLSRSAARFDDLPRGARLGTASLRRQAQALARRPDLEIAMLRGNVDTRIARLEAGEHDAILLAAAGLNRLGLAAHVRELIDADLAVPAPGQGTLAVQTRAAAAAAPWAAALNHAPTALATAAERGAMVALEGSCRTAVGAFARLEAGGALAMTVEALTGDGRARWREEGRLAAPSPEAAAALGLELGQKVRAAAGDRLIVA